MPRWRGSWENLLKEIEDKEHERSVEGWFKVTYMGKYGKFPHLPSKMQERATLLQQLRERKMWPDEMVAMACQLSVKGVDTLLDTYDAAMQTQHKGPRGFKLQGARSCTPLRYGSRLHQAPAERAVPADEDARWQPDMVGGHGGQ